LLTDPSSHAGSAGYWYMDDLLEIDACRLGRHSAGAARSSDHAPSVETVVLSHGFIS